MDIPIEGWMSESNAVAAQRPVINPLFKEIATKAKSVDDVAIATELAIQKVTSKRPRERKTEANHTEKVACNRYEDSVTQKIDALLEKDPDVKVVHIVHNAKRKKNQVSFYNGRTHVGYHNRRHGPMKISIGQIGTSAQKPGLIEKQLQEVEYQGPLLELFTWITTQKPISRKSRKILNIMFSEGEK